MSDKKKRNLIIVLCVLAVVIAVVAIALSPYGKKATGNSDSPNITDNAEATRTVVESSSEKPSETTTPQESESFSPDTTIIIPPSTDPIVNPNKNYTLFIDKTAFESKENDDGTTVLTAKDNGTVKITITPVRDMSYKQCCSATEKNHKKLGNSAKLKIENTNTAYRSQTGDSDSDIITTVYCVDDKKGGCIVIECRTPIGATKYMETIEIMLSMFKVL